MAVMCGMRPVDIKKFKHNDKLASKRRHRFEIKIGLIIFVVVVILVGIGYALFYAPWLRVTTISYEGLTDGHQRDVQGVIDENLNRKVFGIPIGRDIFFVQSDSLVAELISRFSFIENVSVKKKYLHTLKISVTERRAEGVWCFVSTGSSQEIPDCRYFDHDGVTFGQAIQSSGVLLLNVNDMRIQSASTSPLTVYSKFLKAIQTVVPILIEQGVKVKNITIPVDTYTEFDVLVNDPILPIGASYLVKFSIDSNLQNQLDTFRIFRTQKMANGTLKPQYIDLRFDDRVYFK
ncbi:MAG: hypothetical protein A2735_02000 [Candidatus Yanofskybacteria bacterium RIFCSPHIGHO2_01_FULL_41_21]|uniref:POTRA domain-containing protein n=1 Tax=Candidatus Yanofskybacteria bacterium RIFCSPHIGHO2_01_FULL_41_21 TaxID=1802660 RepID=A0A1F8E9A6_9BACT|nr:MAG: hypothetical protein A2735_02000 [Candidatus Yanofskybacteria bacterium RIFCSPHIGHO2_01_FULL_41_21]